MRPIIVLGMSLAAALASSLAFAQDHAVALSTVTTPTSTSTTTTTTPPVPAAGTTTTTQAEVATTPPIALGPSTTEYRGETKTVWLNRPLLGTGLVLFGGTYAASAIVAAESTNPHDNPNLYYPIAGPWMDMAQRGLGAGDKVLLAFDGVTQGVGALTVLTSFFIPESSSRHWFFVGSDDVHVTPSTVGSGYGLGAAGRF
jgi:hypothetical protein